MSDVGFARFWARVTACHVVTYFVFGVLAYYLFDYAAVFASETLSCYMRPTTSRWIALGPSLQVFRGLVFALALWPFRRVFLEGRYGWLKLWGLLVGLSILSTAGAAPGSIEGLIYTKPHWLDQIKGLREVVAQTAAFSYLVVVWHRRPRRAWGYVMSLATVLIVLMSVVGALAAPR